MDIQANDEIFMAVNIYLLGCIKHISKKSVTIFYSIYNLYYCT